MPLASMSNVTSICGTPRGAGGRSTSWNLPSVLLNCAISRSPCSTWISTDGCMSSAVVNTSVRRVGIVVLRSMSLVITPPLVSMPSDSGVTSRSRTSLTSPFEHAGLDGGADGDDLVGVDALVGLLAGELLHEVLHRGHAGRAADEDDVVDLVLGEPGVLDRLLERLAAALEQVGGELLELRARQLLVEVQRAFGGGGDERQVDLRLLHLRQLDLRLLGRFLQPLQRHVVLRTGRRRARP